MGIAHLIVQILILAGLIWYALETWRIRKASLDQNEIMQKPCLVPVCERRDRTSWVLAEGAPSERILASGGSNNKGVELCNIGNGPAFNVRYKVQHQGETKEDSYLPYVLLQESEHTYLSLNSLREYEDSELTLSYESLGKRRYESKIRIKRDYEHQLVPNYFQFKEITPPRYWWVKITRWVCPWHRRMGEKRSTCLAD